MHHQSTHVDRAFMNSHDSDKQHSQLIENWLETILIASQPLEPAVTHFHWNQMAPPTPPVSDVTPTKNPNRSPKRPRRDTSPNQSIWSPFDTEDTPKGPKSLPPINLPLHPLPPLRNQTPSVSSTSRSSVRSGSSSPVKRSTLQLLLKPVHFVRHTTPKDHIPQDALPTFRKIARVSNIEEFVPKAVKDIMETEYEDLSRNWWYFEHPAEDAWQHLQELARIRKILARAESRQQTQAHESSWNVDVHGPLLELALEPHPSLSREIITHGKISRTFVPSMKTESYYDMTRSKMVDWVVTVDPPSPTAQRIRHALFSKPDNERTINQTAYGPVRNNPIALSIETKIGTGNLEDARSQLGFWVAAWHQRMHLLAPHQKSRIITLPLIMVIEDEWRLMFACDTGDEIHVVEQGSIGSTGDLKDVYRLITVLRILAAWMESEYIDWLDKWLGGPGLAFAQNSSTEQ